jgi:hypothetical protein
MNEKRIKGGPLVPSPVNTKKKSQNVK